MSNYINENDDKYCGFCGKEESQVVMLQAGPICFICDECVKIAYKNLNRNNHA